ncbi:putative importin 11 [Whalleya microplaca]|nr:putative importin 11 [Whalleya microplaca]
MNFAIEVPGAATPLGFQELCRILQLANSHDNSQRQAAGDQLSSWEADLEYYPALQSVYLDRQLPREIRLLAIIQLKNGVERHWRHFTVKNAIKPTQKQAIRERLFEGTVGEGDRQLALHNALVLSKVLRMDFPQDWPDPVTKIIYLLRRTKDGSQLELSGTLMILLRVVKELGTARLQKSQTSLKSVTPELVYVLGEIYDVKASTWISALANGQGESDEVRLAIDNSLTAFKVLRRLLVAGYDYPHKDQTVQQVWSLSQNQFGQLLNFYQNSPPTMASYVDIVGKHLIQFTKLHIEMAEMHAASFASLPNSLDLVRAYWDLVANFAEVFDRSDGIRKGNSSADEAKPKASGPLLERLALKGLLLIRACVRMVHRPKQTIRYRSKEAIQEQHQAIDVIKTDLLTNDLVTQMANVIITRLFIFRKADLDAWDEEPQEWEQEQDCQGSSYEWEIRPCAEKLFLDLLTHFKHLLLQPLLSYFITIQDPQTDIVTKEAVYTAMGLSAPLVCDGFDFEGLLRSIILVDAQQSRPLCQIIRRRIAIVLAQWIPVKISKETRPLVYEIFRHLLNPNDQHNDVVVRITAARQFKTVVEDFGFEGEAFLPYASDVLTQLIDLLQEVEIDETKLAILETTRSLIQHMETHVSRFGDFVMNSLPGIWESAGELNYMMKQAVLAIMQTLVNSMQTESAKYQPMILPLIAEATGGNAEMYLYLIDEALDLWVNVLSQTAPPLSPQLLSLAQTAIKYLTDQDEHARSYITIVGSYIVLAPETLLEDQFRRPVLTALLASLGSRHRDHITVATKHTDTFIRLSHDLGGMPGLRLIVQDMVETGFLTKIFEDIHDAYEAHQTTGPKKRSSRVSNLVLTDYFAILSRIAVIDPTIFVEVLASLSPLDQIWSWLSAEWFSSMDSVADISRSKLNLLALTRLLELPEPMQKLVLMKLQEYFSMWTSTMLQILDDGHNPGNDLLVLNYEPEGSEWDTQQTVRERALWASDPLRRVQSLLFVKERLHNLAQAVGGEQAFQDNWAVNVDRDVLAGFQALDQPRDPDA